jgi:peptidyl-prolyl cis-trans isomerase A (cyclophilin A)
VHPDLLDPSKANEKAPAVFKAKFTTTKGDFVIEVHRDWAPNGADRFYNLVKMGFFDDTRFFRAIDGFMVQFGISGDPAVSSKWQSQSIQDDPVKQSNKRGYVTFAQTSAPNSRSTQVFVNYGDNSRLDGQRFAPLGQVTTGMDVADSFFKGYGESPSQPLIQSQGNAYLDSKFDKLDRIKQAVIAP